MADRYWVGGSGNWSDAAAHWSDSTNGTPGAGFLPTSADDVYFDGNSNVGTGTFTVTVDGTAGSPSICKSFSTGGVGGALDGAMTLAFGATGYLDVYGSMTLPATNYSQTGSGGRVTFKSTASGNTFTTNGVTFTGVSINFDGVGGAWTLGSALTFSSTYVITVLNGTFDSGNYNMTGTALQSSGSGTRTINLGSSTLTLSGTGPINLSGSNLTFNAGTSTISCSSGSVTFSGGGYTFYNVTMTSTSTSVHTISGANTYNNLTITTPAATNRRVTFDANQTINNTLTLGAANTAVRRITCRSDTVGVQRTLTVATLATLADVDFGDIKAAGASASSPWSGTRIGDCGGNNNITFTAAGDKYWYSATGAGGNWSAAQWETSAGGTSPSVNNFPLPQDTVKFQDTGLSAGNTISIDGAWNLPAINGSARTLSMTLASAANIPSIFGDFNIPSVVTITGTGVWTFRKQGTQNVTTNGVTITWPVTVENGSGSVKLLDNFTSSGLLTLTSGNLNLNDKVATFTAFSSSNSNTRSVSFGTGKIAVTINNTTVVNMATMTNFSYTGTPLIDSTYSGSTGTRSFSFANASGGATEANAVSLKVSAGSDTINVTTVVKDLDLSGYSGTMTNNTRTLYGNLTVSATATLGTGANVTTFAATSGTQTITTNGVTIGSPITINAPGATVKLVGATSLDANSNGILTAGTFNLNDQTFTCRAFGISGSTTRVIAFGTGKIVLTGLNRTVWTGADLTSFSFTGTSNVEMNYSGGTGTRTIQHGTTAGGTENSAVNFYVTAGTDTVATQGSVFKTFDLTGFSGVLTGPSSPGERWIYGNLVLSATTTWSAGTGATVFKATSGTQTITTNGVTIDAPVTINAPGATVQLTDALTVGATRTFTLSAGTLKLKNGTTNTAGAWAFTGTVSNPISLQSTSAGSQATISQSSGTVNATYLTVKDSVATGGGTFNAFTGTGSSLSNYNVNNGNNRGWNFIPAGASFINFF